MINLGSGAGKPTGCVSAAKGAKTMRLIMFAGKGGTGKTSLASATGARAAARGKRTLILSLDPGPQPFRRL